MTFISTSTMLKSISEVRKDRSLWYSMVTFLTLLLLFKSFPFSVFSSIVCLNYKKILNGAIQCFNDFLLIITNVTDLKFLNFNLTSSPAYFTERKLEHGLRLDFNMGFIKLSVCFISFPAFFVCSFPAGPLIVKPSLPFVFISGFAH